MDRYELVERYEALGDEDDFLVARRLFDQELTGRPGLLDHWQYGYLLECHRRRTLRRAVDQYEQAMALDPEQDKVQYQWMHAKAALGEVIATGLALAPGDPKLIADQGEVKAARDDPYGALADWRRAHELNPEDFGPVYSSAFLFEDQGRKALERGVTSWSTPARTAGN